MIRLREDTRHVKGFRRDDRVRKSQEYLNKHAWTRDWDRSRFGTVVGFGGRQWPNIVYVVWDGNKSRDGLPSEYLEKTGVS